MVSYNLSDLFEVVADQVGDRPAIIVGSRRELSYAELEERANRLAHHLAAAGVGADDAVGLLLMNGAEYLEGMLAAFKLRAVPINVNYRYVARELEQVFVDAGVVALVFHRRFSPEVESIAPRVRTLEHLVVVEDGSDAPVPDAAIPYEDALAGASPARDFEGRSSDDRYIAYTGGTTGLPNGVIWRHEDIFFASMGGGDPTRTEGVITAPEQLRERVLPVPPVQVITAPLMHVSGHWGAFSALFSGTTIAMPEPGPFDPVAVLDFAARVGANVITLVGDAMMRPLAELVEQHPGRWDLGGLFVLASGGALLSSSTKDLVRRVLPSVIVVDGFGSTETGIAASEARLNGVRWALPGDHATVEADGTIVLLGRGSQTINTGGEKVFPEEVEEVLLAHPGVRDVIVIGMPDERWGQRIVAVAAARPGVTLTLDDLQRHCRAAPAGSKVPRELVVVDTVERGPSGKADYGWARDRAAGE